MIRPNLFIIGAPKCGTSSLFNWLLMHPDIVGTKTKEPLFLIDPAHPLAKESNVANEGLEDYKNLFDVQDTHCSVRMEATPITSSILSRDAESGTCLIQLSLSSFGSPPFSDYRP